MSPARSSPASAGAIPCSKRAGSLSRDREPQGYPCRFVTFRSGSDAEPLLKSGRPMVLPVVGRLSIGSEVSCPKRWVFSGMLLLPWASPVQAQARDVSGLVADCRTDNAAALTALIDRVGAASAGGGQGRRRPAGGMPRFRLADRPAVQRHHPGHARDASRLHRGDRGRFHRHSRVPCDDRDPRPRPAEIPAPQDRPGLRFCRLHRDRARPHHRVERDRLGPHPRPERRCEDRRPRGVRQPVSRRAGDRLRQCRHPELPDGERGRLRRHPRWDDPRQPRQGMRHDPQWHRTRRCHPGHLPQPHRRQPRGADRRQLLLHERQRLAADRKLRRGWCAGNFIGVYGEGNTIASNTGTGNDRSPNGGLERLHPHHAAVRRHRAAQRGHRQHLRQSGGGQEHALWRLSRGDEIQGLRTRPRLQGRRTTASATTGSTAPMPPAWPLRAIRPRRRARLSTAR